MSDTPHYTTAHLNLTAHHITSHHITSHHITSHCNTTPHPSPHPSTQVMKDKARVLHDANKKSEVEEVEGGSSLGPMYRSIIVKLKMLKPEELVVEDESYKHAGAHNTTQHTTPLHPSYPFYPCYVYI